MATGRGRNRGQDVVIGCCVAAFTGNQVLAILLLGDGLDFVLGNQVCQADPLEKMMNLVAKILPQVMGQAGFPALTVSGAATSGGIYRLIDGVDDLRDIDRRRCPLQFIAAAGAANAAYQRSLAQFRKQLLKVGKGDGLAL